MDAALSVFATTSYAGATTARIAREAGVSEPILYRHFPSKATLYVACLDASWLRLRSAWEEARAVAEPEERLVAASNAAIALADRGTVLPPVLWLQAFSEAGHDPEIGRAVRRVVREVHVMVRDALAEAQRLGAIRAEHDVDAEAWVVLGVLLLRAFAARMGDLIGPEQRDAIRAQRLAWLRGSLDRPGGA